MKIFGREPSVWIGLIEAALAFILTTKLFGDNLSPETMGAIMACVVAVLGFYTAFVTKDTLLGVGVGLAKAVIALFAAYGLALSTDQTGALIALVTVVFGFFQRTQTSPLLTPSFKDGASAGEVAA
jgi:uncharacterized membrane protein